MSLFIFIERFIFMNSIWYILLVGVALSVDAFTVSVTNGIVESKMSFKKVLLIALFYGAFQFLMPVTGYFLSSTIEVFIKNVAHWISFALLLFVGGSMIFDGIKETIRSRSGTDKKEAEEAKPLTLPRLSLQAVATSIDALAVGITMLACEAADELFANVWIDAAIIGVTTFCLCVGGVMLGKCAGNKIKVPSAAGMVGGGVLILLGLKILLQGLGVIDLGF